MKLTPRERNGREGAEKEREGGGELEAHTNRSNRKTDGTM